MYKPPGSCATGLAAILASLVVAVAPRPSFGAARWSEFAPPAVVNNQTIYDSQRDRALVFTDIAIWAVSSDPVPLWSKIWTGPFPFGGYFVYDSVGDQIWAFNMSANLFTGQLWSMELGTQPLTWVQHTYSGSAPFRLSSFAYAFDPIRRRVVLFGGNFGCPGCETNSVRILQLGATPAWITPLVQGTPPTQRVASSAVYDPIRDRMIFFGGLIFGPTYYDESWALSMTMLSWNFLYPRNQVPPARGSARVGLDAPGQRMMMTGGTSSQTLNDTWALDLSLFVPADSADWTDHSVTQPPLRNGPIAWVDEVHSRLLRFGGSMRADLWALSLDGSPAWSPVVPDSLRPPVRYGHVAFMDPVSERWFVGLGNPQEVYSREEGWQRPWELEAAGGPGTRYWAGAVRDGPGARALVFGGGFFSYPGVLGIEYADLWAFEFGSSTWTPLSPASTPTVRADALVVMDTDRRWLVVHGGRFSAPTKMRPRTDTWVYDVAANSWSLMAAGSFGGRWSEAGIYDPVRDRVVAFGGMDTLVSYSDVHVLPLPGGTWSTLTTLGTPPPIDQPRSLRATYDAAGDRMLVLASDGTNLGVYALSLGLTPTWSVVAVQGDPPPRRREGYAMTADATGTRLIVNGGDRDGSGSLVYDDNWELYFDETTSAPPSARGTGLSLVGARPNPAFGVLRVAFSLESTEPATLELFDVAGRRLVAREVGALGPGPHVLTLATERALGAGIHFLRLSQGVESRRARTVVVR